MRHGVIYKHTDGTTRFVTTSGRMYIWAYGAWRFKFQHHNSLYSMFRRAARLNDSKVFVASSRKVFMEKRVALEPLDYQFHDFTGRRMSKSRLFRRKTVGVCSAKCGSCARHGSTTSPPDWLSAHHHADAVLRA